MEGQLYILVYVSLIIRGVGNFSFLLIGKYRVSCSINCLSWSIFILDCLSVMDVLGDYMLWTLVPWIKWVTNIISEFVAYLFTLDKIPFALKKLSSVYVLKCITLQSLHFYSLLKEFFSNIIYCLYILVFLFTFGPLIRLQVSCQFKFIDCILF